MRHLTPKQKKILDEVVAASTDFVKSCDEQPRDWQKRLEGLNDYETLFQDADRYLFDKFMEKRLK